MSRLVTSVPVSYTVSGPSDPHLHGETWKGPRRFVETRVYDILVRSILLHPPWSLSVGEEFTLSFEPNTTRVVRYTPEDLHVTNFQTMTPRHAVVPRRSLRLNPLRRESVKGVEVLLVVTHRDGRVPRVSFGRC